VSTQGFHPYYAGRRVVIQDGFDESLLLSRPHFATLLADHDFEEIRKAALGELDRVIPTLPYVGGAEGRMTQYFEQNAGIFALGRVLRARSVPGKIMSQLLKHVFLAKLRTRPRDERLAMGEQFLSEGTKSMLRKEAVKSQLKENTGDFAYRFIDKPAASGAEAFDFGLDYNECGFCKMSKTNNDGDILPMICAMDEESYALRGVRLTRTTTLADGDRCCNFRYGKLEDDQVP